MNYTILSFDEAYKRVKYEKTPFPGKQRTDNLAFEVVCKNLNVLLFPSLGNKVVLFESVVDYNDFFTQNTLIPLPEPLGNIFALYQEQIADIESNTVFLIEKLSTVLNTELIVSTNSKDIANTSTVFNKYIRSIGKDNAYLDLSFLAGIYCGELIKKHINKGSWIAEKRHGINPYLSLNFVIDDEVTIIFKAITDEMQRNKLNVKNCANRVLPMKYARIE